MRRIAVLLLAAAALGAIAFALLDRPDTAAGTAPLLAGAPAGATRIARGEYLTRAADCTGCHTVPGSGRPFAGGVAFALAIGTIYSTNITSDPVLGIGRWSDEDFVRAVRRGIGRHGEHLYPVFPYTEYTRMSRDDVLAIKAYLLSLPAVPQKNRAADLAFPFDQRWAMGVWNAAFFRDRRFAMDASRSAQWNRGAYLADVLGHCGECHTPRNMAYGLERGREFTGERLQGWLAYNITSDTKFGIGAWRYADIAQYLATGCAAGHGSAAGPMGEVVENSLQYLHPSDLAALIVYLRSVPPRPGQHRIGIDNAPPAARDSTAGVPADGDSSAHPLGLALFEGACASCHRGDGRGRQSPYAALLGTRSVNDASAVNVTRAILDGARLHVGTDEIFMPPFAAAYSNSEVAALANYVVAHFGAKKGIVTADQVAERRAL